MEVIKKTYSQLYYEANKDYFKSYRKKNRDKNRLYFRIYGEMNKKSLRSRFSVLKSSAKQRKLKCDLTLDQFIHIVKEPCYYCNKSNTDTTGSGIDRIENIKGYSFTNSLSCCKDCNKVRSDVLSTSEMKVAMDAVIAYRKKL